ncbi:GNAT family N-acetyltransferase [Rothia sp. ZJ1223]|uniref:GNAT family N-acetyltransferase n=1 Tax=Rothia sp. ZJ1223 TaxID=2811098 RepID=UPI001959B11A|nr:GNAT family N-acetyltransferase [Rothia sp. ZJ1223]MBM7051318.1 GNAT family N-acetyltransferase [Rothia sp. ZJ1223]
MKPKFARDQRVILRPLTSQYFEDLHRMMSYDPVAHLFEAEHLNTFGLPATGRALPVRPPYGFVGIFEREVPDPGSLSAYSETANPVPQVIRTMTQHFLGRSATTTPAPREELVGAIWLCGNCVPLQVPEQYLDATAEFIMSNSRYLASIFGVAELVRPLWERSQHGFQSVMDERPHQPLLYLAPHTQLHAQADLYRHNLRVPAIDYGVRWARTTDRSSLLQASVAMFTEEVGYDPLERDATGYARRVSEFITGGRSLVATNSEGVVVFKVDLGLAHNNHCQLQGVWLHPAYRGHGLSAPLLAQVCQLIRPRYAHISLYVNDYNARARALYRAVGFEQINTFSTILF